MRVVLDNGTSFSLGETEATPSIGITDFSRRVTDDFGVTTVVERGFSRRLSVKLALPFDGVSALQQRLADLRATSSLWVASERIDWLSVRGFYKDFDIDHAVPPVSYCTLTVEGLAETSTAPDDGSDPAPVGATSTLRLLQPANIDGAALANSSVAENDYAEWSAGVAYPIGSRVIKAATHRVYESAAAANAGNDPAGVSGKWLDVGPTNRWAMFDQALGSVTSAVNTITVALDVTSADAVALLDVTGAAVRVQADWYDRTVDVTAGAITFLDLPLFTGRVTVTITGPGQVAVGTLLVGRVRSLGITEASPTAGITDYSRKAVDDFGDFTIVQRAWSRRMTAKALIRTGAVDIVANRIAAVRARPSLWIGQAGLDSLTVYGFFKDFSIEVGVNVSKVSLTIEGLSKAPPAPKPTPEGASVVAQGSIDGINWHIGLQAGDVFMRISNDSGVTYGDAVRIAGEDGMPGEDGSYQQQIFRRAPTRPATPTGGGIPSGWFDGVPEGTDLIWLSVQYQRNGVALGPWSAPAQIKGDRGEDGLSAPLVLVQWSIDGASNWHFEYQAGDKFQRQSNDNGQSWGPAVRVVGESAQSGVDGISPSIVFIRSATVPATPAQDTGNPPPGWSDDPSAGTMLLWQSVSKFRGGMQLEGWSAPVRISGADGKDGASAFTLLDIQYCSNPGPATVTKRGGGENWNAKARTAESGVATTVSGLLVPGVFMGLTTDPFAGFGYSEIDYAIHWSDDTGIFVWRNGVKMAGIGLRPTENGPVRATIRSDGRSVSYSVEGYTQPESHPVNGAGERVFGTFALLHDGSAIAGITFSVDGQPGADGASAPLIKTQWSINGVDNWHDNFFGADAYQRQSNDNGVTYGPAVRAVGESGDDGVSPSQVFQRSATVPNAPANNSGNPPTGWFDGPPAGTDFIWQTSAKFRAGVQISSWTTPQRISGTDGKSPYLATVATTQMTVSATAGGATKADALPKMATLRVKRGADDVTATASVSLTANPANALAMSYASGVLSLNQADGEGYVDVLVKVGPIVVDTIRISVRRVLDTPPAGVTSSFDYVVSTFTYDARVTPIMTVAADLNGQVRGEMYATYDAGGGNGNFSVAVAAKMQIRPANTAGGSDMGAEVVGSTASKSGQATGGNTDPDAPPPPDPIPGGVSFATTVGGLIPGQNYEVWGLLRRYSGNATAISNGTVTGRKP